MRISDWSSDVCSSDLSGTHLRGVHVAAPTARCQRGTHFTQGWGNPDGAVHRIQRQRNREPAVERPEVHLPLRGVEVIDPGALRQCLVQQGGVTARGERSEERHRGADTPVMARFNAGEVNRKGRSEEHTSELQTLMRISYAVF